MRIRLLPLLVAAALTVLGTSVGCSKDTSTEAAPVAQSAAFPQTARYMADAVSADGAAMAIGISVDGDSVAAYACNGTDDEAWFLGNQADGAIDLTSRMRDTLTADYDGTAVTGVVTMNGVAHPFTADAVSGLAGMYTAEAGGARSSWVVRPDGSATGVQFSGFSQGDRDRNFDPFDLDGLTDFQVRHDVRTKRKLGPAGPIEFPDGRPQASINGRPVTPILVTGTFRLP
ncbi:hypothetical protein [Mycobacterium sp. SMC-4]|uniref:hypothetical protein n=1 Tax=Mycobacterium sp. SMC-4 TaxID=2857059 RepID=UPI003CFC1448